MKRKLSSDDDSDSDSTRFNDDAYSKQTEDDSSSGYITVRPRRTLAIEITDSPSPSSVAPSSSSSAAPSPIAKRSAFSSSSRPSSSPSLLSVFWLLRFLGFKMENMNYEDFLLKPKDKWITKSTTNVYCNLNGLPDIVKVLRKVRELAAFRRTCFGHLIDIPKDLTFSAGILHNLLLWQVHVPGVTGQNEFHFSVGGKLLKFTQREFCLIWAMEALGSLIELVRENLGHSHPRLRNWRIFRRPRHFFSKFAKYEQAVKDGQFVPDNLEEDDGREGVDFEVGNDDNDGVSSNVNVSCCRSSQNHQPQPPSPTSRNEAGSGPEKSEKKKSDAEEERICNHTNANGVGVEAWGGEVDLDAGMGRRPLGFQKAIT
ncbi:hypothetical protein LWI29_027810 [Acer saccharum]|uniref:Uncharacterized protein n=1 Tax=Acer saccharum TaxID=4024 RepID=A0AA39TA34_ACESA|nr:hypothetical protein LWI29_027810 [Acer saccharum]